MNTGITTDPYVDFLSENHEIFIYVSLNNLIVYC